MESKTIYDIFHLVYWDWRIALDLFLGGVGIGAFLYIMFISSYKKDENLLSVKIGSVIAPVAVALGVLAMFTELGQPFRIWRTFVNFNPTSILFWGGILQQIFLLLSVIFAFSLLFNKNELIKEKLKVFAALFDESLRKKIGILAAVFAVLVGVYHGLLLSFATARPLWNAGSVNLISFMSAITTGIAAVVICTSLTKNGKNETAELSGVTSNVLVVSILLQLFAIFVWVVSLAAGKADFVNALNTLNSEYGLQFWGLAVFVGLLVPLVILVTKRDRPFPAFLTSALILVGGYAFRYVVVICGQLS